MEILKHPLEILWTSWAILWKTYGKPMENLSKTYGHPVEFLWISRGNPMETLWTSYGNPMELQGKSYGYPAEEILKMKYCRSSCRESCRTSCWNPIDTLWKSYGYPIGNPAEEFMKSYWNPMDTLWTIPWKYYGKSCRRNHEILLKVNGHHMETSWKSYRKSWR